MLDANLKIKASYASQKNFLIKIMFIVEYLENIDREENISQL